MSFDPRTWGRPAQAALALVILLRVPYVLAQPSAVAAAGALTGAILGAVLVVAVGRWAVGAVRGLRTTDAPN